MMALLLVCPSLARAETDPRDYTLALAPDHTNVFVAYARRRTSADSQSFAQNISYFRYLHVLKFGDLAFVPVDVILPALDAQVYIPTATGTTTAHGSGIGDLIYLPTIAYSIKESESSVTYFAFSSYFRVPTGNYDHRRAVNAGSNRWQFDEQVVVGQRLLNILVLEALGAVSFYTKNDDAIAAGTTTRIELSQSPTFTGTVHVSADVTKELWLGASYYYTANGEVTASTPTGDRTATEQQSVQSLRGTVGIKPVAPLQLLLQYNTDIAATHGATISRFVGVRFSYRF
ncbi:transporter [Pendulispora albinea]|uniref:Transporter n=1 Tax=Pendulispora albinea TaxID=2741071 RepID=A0ABZ2LZ19_9BACT